MSDNNQALTIFEPKNVQTLATLAPQSYNENQLSHTRCLAAGSHLLLRVREEGMSDTLDMEIARFIEKAKITLRKMNDKRTPVTQLFDRIRKVYTSMENDVDPSKADSIPNQLQDARNAYAKKKHEEAERLRREEMARQQREQDILRYNQDAEEDFKRQFDRHVTNSIDQLTHLNQSLTLANFEEVSATIKGFTIDLGYEWFQHCQCFAHKPLSISDADAIPLRQAILDRLSTQFKAQYTAEIGEYRDSIVDALPSKKRELERMAKASAEEAARIKADMEAKDRQEAARKEAERKEREKQEAAAARLAAQKQEMDGLFGIPVAPPAGYQPKTQVKKKVVIETAEDIMKVVAFWWSQEGCTKSVEELCKEFKKQITYANTAANSKDAPIFIADVRYRDEVKAK